MGRPKLKDVMKDNETVRAEASEPTPVLVGKEKPRAINHDEAQVLCKLGMAPIKHGEKARRALQVYLEHTLEQPEVDDDDALAAINILKNASTTIHRDLCDKVLTKYLEKFDGLIPAKEPVKA